ncbi:MAG: hypothetical protein IPM32_04565 [Ignavibacteriae bacterium]|nr:hypothetical protein [Ignavibacteriota bacterium]
MNLSKLIFTILIFSSLVSFAQSNTNQDSIKNISEYKLRLNDNSLYISPLFSFKMPIYEDPHSQLILPNFEEQIPQTEAISIMQLRNNINQSLQIYKKGLNKNDLGVVGDILGYTNAAAAIGLAAYHVYKYKEHYGFKKK